MPLVLEVKLPDGQPAKVYAGNWCTFSVCQQIIDREVGKKGAWGSIVEPHITQKDYTWEVVFTDDSPETVTLPKGSSILMYRGW